MTLLYLELKLENFLNILNLILFHFILLKVQLFDIFLSNDSLTII